MQDNNIACPEYHEYQLCFTAFVDILGFENSVLNVNDKNTLCDIWSLLKFIKEKMENNIRIDILSKSEIIILVVSDSIIIVIPCNERFSIFTVIMLILDLQKSLIFSDFKKLVRGYVSLGNVYFNDEILFGEGYQKAYNGANIKGMPPQIIISDEIIDKAIHERNVKYPTDNPIYTTLDTIFSYLYKFKEKDANNKDSYMIDYFKPYKPDIMPIEKQKIEFNSINDFIADGIKKFKHDGSIRKKYEWLSRYYKISKHNYNY
jgi:hypothetical protein